MPRIADADAGTGSSRYQWPDPTRVFSYTVILIMTLRYILMMMADNDSNSHTTLLYSVIKGFYGHPQVLLSLGVYSLPYLARYYYDYDSSSTTNKKKYPPIRASDEAVAEWYWWNAVLYHTVMDGLSGSFHQIPVVVQQYFVLDARFQSHHVVPWLIGVIELFIMAPLCLCTLHSILLSTPPVPAATTTTTSTSTPTPSNQQLQQLSSSSSIVFWSSIRFPLEIITSTFQLFGMLAFVGAELYEGQVHVPALDPVGQVMIPNSSSNHPMYHYQYQFKFNLYHVTYYWFGFWFCNLVWGVVPIYRIFVAVRACSSRNRATSTLLHQLQQLKHQLKQQVHEQLQLQLQQQKQK